MQDLFSYNSAILYVNVCIGKAFNIYCVICINPEKFLVSRKVR